MENKRHYRAAVLTIVLAAVSAFMILFSSLSVAKTADSVDLMIQSCGEPSEAEGLKIGYVEGTWSARSFTYSAKLSCGALKDVSSGIYMSSLQYNDTERNDIEIGSAGYLWMGLPKVTSELNNIASKLSPGESKDVTLKLSDYYEYYPLSVSWNSPGRKTANGALDNELFEVKQSYRGGRLYDEFVKRFSLPVPEGQIIRGYAGKNSNGIIETGIYKDDSIAELGNRSGSGVLFGDYYYVGFSADYVFPEFAGTVWRIPCGELAEPIRTESGATVTRGPIPEKAELFYSLEPGWTMPSGRPLRVSKDGSVLFIYCENESRLRVCCLTDPDAGAEKLITVDIPGPRYGFEQTGVDEKSLFVRGKNNTIWCIHPEGNTYALTVFTDDREQMKRQFGSCYTYSQVMNYAYKDGRLALARMYHTNAAEETGKYDWRYTGLAVFVYSPEKLEYAAQIKSSISEAMNYCIGNGQIASGMLYTTSLSWK